MSFINNHRSVAALLAILLLADSNAFTLPQLTHQHHHAPLTHESSRFHISSFQRNQPILTRGYHIATSSLRASPNNDNSGSSDRKFFFPVPGARRDSPTATEDPPSKTGRKTVTTVTKDRSRSKKVATSVQIVSPQNLQKLEKEPTTPLAEIEDPPLLDFSNPKTIFSLAAGAGVVAVTAISYSLGLTVQDYAEGAQTLFRDPSAFSQQLLAGVQGLGPIGMVYFALLYMIAEILAIPATPLTLSAGYLFGIQQGVLAVLAGATGAACVGFWISRTFLRDYVESSLLAPSPDGQPNKMAKIDKAIGRDGFKLLVLIRLSPIFPFSITNYLYGASSIDFGSYLLGTLIGFVPTTTAYVYTGMVGQALTGGGADQQPWYVYAGGFAALSVLVKLVTDVASGIIDAIDDDENDNIAM
mmetsp:Transcript_133014/g.384703  ORF Transcript_133014/g.384703 Transcript_133014/m.384703 type:complete len:414 (-) Transcript_133014:301-1542(-)